MYTWMAHAVVAKRRPPSLTSKQSSGTPWGGVPRKYTSKGDDVLRKTIGLVVSLSITAGPGLVFAQNAAPATGDNSGPSEGRLKEVVVTAEYRRQNLQTVPNAISVYTGAALADSGVTGVEGLTEVSPSLVWGNSAGEPHLSIRGIGNELINIGAEPGVTLAQDGVPLASSLLFQQDFLDLADVEVLRGPQGTVSGRNSPGGAVDFTSNQPTATPEGEASIGYGNFNRIQTSDYVSGPIIGDELLGRLAVSYVKDDGWLDNTYVNQEEQSLNNLHYRGYLTFRPSDTFKASLIVENYTDRGYGLAGVDAGRVQPNIPSLSEYYLGQPSFNINNLTFQQDSPGPFHSNGGQDTLRAVWDFGSSGTLTSTTAFQDLHQYGNRNYPAIPLPINLTYLKENLTQLSQEITYITNLSQRADLVVGGLFVKQHSGEPFGLGSPTTPIGFLQFVTYQQVTSEGLYAQLRYKLTDTLRLTVGDRETRDAKTYDQTLFVAAAPSSIPTASGSWTANTPRVALDYTPTSDLTYYLNIARGFTSGGFNTFSGQKFNPEYVTSYELGLKSYWLDRHLKVDLSAFHSDFKDIQTVLFVPTAGGVATSLSVTNAGGAKIDGIEAEVEARVTDRFLLSASGTLLNARYTQLESVDGSVPQEGELNLAGNKLPRAPDQQFDVGAHYTNIPVAENWLLSFHGNYAWQSKIYFNFFNQPLMSQGAYGLLDVSAVLNSADGKWELTAFSNNAADKRYWSNKQFGTGLAVPYANGMIGEPRTYGIKIARRF